MYPRTNYEMTQADLEKLYEDEFEEILGGSWAVIRTEDGWEIESQHSQTTLPLKSTDMESAKIEGRKIARQFEKRYLPNA
jgi:hypothetical protein